MAGRSLDELGVTLSWRDLLVFLRGTVNRQGAALRRAVHGDVWTIEAQLLALAVDTLAVANWQRAGKKHAPKPKPIPRPWQKQKDRKFGADPIPISQFDAWWDAATARKAG